MRLASASTVSSTASAAFEQSNTTAANTNDPTGGGQHRSSLDPGDWIALNRRYYLGNMDKKIQFRYAGGGGGQPVGNDRMAVEIRSGREGTTVIMSKRRH